MRDNGTGTRRPRIPPCGGGYPGPSAPGGRGLGPGRPAVTPEVAVHRAARQNCVSGRVDLAGPQ
jgi:hypothetical protein